MKTAKLKQRIRKELYVLLQIAVLILLIRTLIFEPFYIPSGSMESTLERGDFVIVWKWSYGYSKFSIPFAPINFSGRILPASQPESGDVAVFRNPSNTKINYIKRIIGLPGDKVQLSQGRLFLNGGIVNREADTAYTPPNSLRSYPRYREFLPSGKTHAIVERYGDNAPIDNTYPYEVPPHHYFAMGDNRDASQDSRYISSVGFIPKENLIGRASVIFFSLDMSVPWWQIWRKIRFSRIGTRL